MTHSMQESPFQALDQPVIAIAEDAHDTTTQTVLQEGLQRLGGNIVAVMSEHGTTGVSKYLHDVLADTESHVPADERLAAFTMLSQEQIKTTRRDTCNAGETMVAGLKFGLSETEKIYKSTKDVHDTIATVKSQHAEKIGRLVNLGRIESGQLSLAHGEVRVKAVKAVDAVGLQRHTMAKFVKLNGEIITGFDAVYGPGVRLERTLEADRQKFDTQEERAAEDVSGHIQTSTYDQVSNKIAQALEAAEADGVSPVHALLAVLESSTADPADARRIKAFGDLAETYDRALADCGSKVVRRGYGGLADRLEQYKTGGKSFADNKDVNILMGIVQKQGRTLADIGTFASSVKSAEAKFFRDIDEAVRVNDKQQKSIVAIS